MADLEISNGGALWSSGLTFALLIMGYFIKRRDLEIDKNREATQDQRNDHIRLELKMSETYATKQSLSTMFQETQRLVTESNNRQEKMIDDVKREVEKTNGKFDLMQTTILNSTRKP